MLISSCGWNDLELLVGAVLGCLVGAPAAEVREVPEAVALHVLIGDLDHKLDAQRLPAQVFAALQRDWPPGMRPLAVRPRSAHSAHGWSRKASSR